MKLKHTLLTGLLATILLSGGCNKLEPVANPTDRQSTPSIMTVNAQDQNDDRYIVVYKNSVADPSSKTSEIKRGKGIAYGHIYKGVIKGFSARLNAKQIEALKSDADIDFIEKDIKQHAFFQDTPSGIQRMGAVAASLASDNSSVDIAVFDSGIDISHPDLTVSGGVHFYSVANANGTITSYSDNNYSDDYGHGTHVAGVIAASNNDFGVIGVAPGAKLWSIKVLDSNGDGYASDVIKGLEWVAERASTFEIINLSLGGAGYSQAYRTAIKNCVAKGIVIFAAAGNDSRDVYGYDRIFGTSDDEVPAAFPEVAAVSAFADSDGLPGGFGYTTNYGADDSYATFSNFSTNVVSNNPVNSPGKAIDLIMPGVSIYSTYMGQRYATMSGTSQATPHAAGLAALYIARYGRATDSLGVYRIRQALINMGQSQSSSNGLKTQNDPDGFKENLGWAGALGSSSSNTAPVANAGSDQTVEELTSVTLNGTASYDPEGATLQYFWSAPAGIVLNSTTSPTPQFTAPDITTATTYTISLVVFDGMRYSDPVYVNITVTPYEALSLKSLSPSAIYFGTTNVTFTGTGLKPGAKITFESGTGSTPVASNIKYTSSKSISADIYVAAGTPNKTRTWSVRITNSDGKTVVLKKGLTVYASTTVTVKNNSK